LGDDLVGRPHLPAHLRKVSGAPAPKTLAPAPGPQPHAWRAAAALTRAGLVAAQVSGIPIKSLWTPVLYTNTFSVLPAMLLGIAAGELGPISHDLAHELVVCSPRARPGPPLTSA
jgi:hypothetical protein